jgi:maintenance of morphology protein 1
VITPPAPGAHAPSLTLHVPPTFTLELKTTSLLGSRAKLADVPKLHGLIQAQLRRALAARGEWRVVLPGLASVAEVKEEVRREAGPP